MFGPPKVDLGTTFIVALESEHPCRHLALNSHKSLKIALWPSVSAPLLRIVNGNEPQHIMCGHRDSDSRNFGDCEIKLRNYGIRILKIYINNIDDGKMTEIHITLNGYYQFWHI